MCSVRGQRCESCAACTAGGLRETVRVGGGGGGKQGRGSVVVGGGGVGEGGGGGLLT